MEEVKDENYRTVRQEDKEIRILRSCENFQRNFTGQIRRGECDINRPVLEPY